MLVVLIPLYFFIVELNGSEKAAVQSAWQKKKKSMFKSDPFLFITLHSGTITQIAYLLEMCCKLHYVGDYAEVLYFEVICYCKFE